MNYWLASSFGKFLVSVLTTDVVVSPRRLSRLLIYFLRRQLTKYKNNLYPFRETKIEKCSLSIKKLSGLSYWSRRQLMIRNLGLAAKLEMMAQQIWYIKTSDAWLDLKYLVNYFTSISKLTGPKMNPNYASKNENYADFLLYRFDQGYLKQKTFYCLVG